MFRKRQQEDPTAPHPAAPGGKGLKPFLKRHWKQTALLVCAAAAGAAVLLPRLTARQVSGEVQYIEIQPERRSIVNVFSESGTIQAAETYEVKSLVRGDVLTADFQEGDTVEEGAVLYTIDSSDAVNSVEKAQLSLDQAQRDYEDALSAQYVRTDISGTVRSVSGEDTASTGNMLVRSVVIAVPNTSGSLTSSQAATASVNGVSALGSARFSYQNSQTLTASTSGTVAALCVQEGDTVSANTPILQLTSDSLTRQVENASDNLRSAELSVDDAENSLEDYTITAPISGTIIQKNIQAGETIGTDTSSSETLCVIHDLSYLEMTLAVDELEILSIQEGQDVTITADALSDQTFSGVVTNVSSAGTTTGGTTTYPVTIRIDDYGEPMPGMNATAQIVVDSADDALSVPNAAVVRGGYVLVTEDSPSAANAADDMSAPAGYVYVKVKTGVSDDNYIAITSGLQEGDTVAYDADAATITSGSGSGMMMPGGMGGGMPAGGGAPGGGMR